MVESESFIKEVSEEVKKDKLFKIVTLTIIFTFILSCFLTKNVDEIKYKDQLYYFLERQAVRDSIIVADSLEILKLRT